MDRLNTVRRHPKSGNTESLAILLHGLGDSGAGLISFADVFGEELPDTMFVAADAPFICPHVPFGYQWFDLLNTGDMSAEESIDEIMRSTKLVISMIVDEIAAAKVDASKVAVFGFSQGAMMALNAVPRMIDPVACIVACSGGYMGFAAMEAIALVKPPVLVLHGDSDEVVPFALFDETAKQLKAAGFNVQTHVMRGAGHQISPDGADVIRKFLRKRIGS